MDELTRKQMLAAELHGYSYANYADHLGVGNIRFEKLMPDEVDLWEQAEQEGWEASRMARTLEIPEKHVKSWQRLYREAKDIVDAPTPAESFRRSVRYSIQAAIEKGLTDKPAVERLVTQICYRAADWGFRLDMEGKPLSAYSEELREESEYDLEALREEIEQDMEEEFGPQSGVGAA